MNAIIKRTSQRFFPAVLACVAISIVSLEAVHANQARHAGMVNNPMVEDDVDIVDFPGMLTAYSDMVFLNLMPPTTGIVPGPSSAGGDGNLGAFFGRRVAVGAWVHRTPRWRDLDDLENLFNFDASLPTTHDLVDLFLGTRVGFGMRISLSAGLDTDENRDPAGKLLSTGGSTFVIDLAPGYSFDLDSYHGDFGVGLTFSTFQLTENGQKTFKATPIPSFFLRHRSVIYPRAVLSGVVDVMLTRRAYAMKAQNSDENYEQSKHGTDMGRWVMSLVGGPKLNIPGNVTLHVGARLTLEHLHGVIDGMNQPSLNALGVPGGVASAEVILFDFLAIRAGAMYEVYWTTTVVPRTKDEVESGQTSAGEQSSGQRFNWSTGLGIMPGDFRIDATVSQNLYFDGPNFIGGREPGFLGILSATYMW
ncbi:MAG: hypothetical protein GY854_15435 [Deltaproteobacteria bacterium]|nr:hypothetical protein [Deltaproteobacteria bacterium]